MSREHTDREYESELRSLREQLLMMAAKVEEMLANCMRALVARDSDLAHRMIEHDDEIDALEVSIDDHCMRMLAKRQPVASDLRFITSALKIVTDLERIGDLGVNICERTIELNAEPQLKPYIDLPHMAEVVQVMVREALDAFVAGNANRAQSVLERDHVVDAYYGQVFRELLVYMMEDTKTINRAIKVQAIAKYLERIGDHATNLAEMVIFMSGGKDIRHTGRKTKRARPHGVLFLCVRNSARSQIAEAWAEKLFPVGVRIWSAGSDPGDEVDPHAVRAMQEAGIDISRARPKSIADIPMGDVDTVITLCSEESCPVLPGDLFRESWPMPDPAEAGGTEDEILDAFRLTRDKLRRRIEALRTSWN
jgi:phosphate transport system protein